MIILGVDVGKQGGLAVYDTELEEFVYTEAFSFCSMLSWYEKLKKIHDVYKLDLMVAGEPMRLFNIVKVHAKFHGVAELICERYEMPIVYVNDRHARVVVFGKGFGNKKPHVHEHFKGDTPDISDAMLFCTYYVESTK